jgi:O-antigen/teichoic acid export membrane protein
MSSVVTTNLDSADNIGDEVIDQPSSAMPSLKQRTIQGASLVISGQVGGQVLRLASNLILTRLLFPGAFGLMMLVQMVVSSVQLFSDFGIYGNIINHKRGEEPLFVNTAWTIQIIRGVLLWLCMCFLAYPAARLWGYEELVYFIPVVGFGAVISGFGSIAPALLNRRVQVGRIVLMNQGTQLIGIVAIVIWAWYFQSIWALVLGSIVNSYTRALLSHYLFGEHRCRLAWDREAIGDMFKYGKWIFVSTALTCIWLHLDKGVLGLMINETELGVYAVALYLSMAIGEMLKKLSRMVLFPVYARLAESGLDRLRRQTFRVRLVLLAVSLPPLWVLAIAGTSIVTLLYDDRYEAAGWMVRILAIGAIGFVVSVTAHGVLLAKRDSFRFMILQVARVVLIIGGVCIGGWQWGLMGVLVGTVVARLAEYPVLAWAISRYNTWMPALDMGAFAVSAAVIAGGWYLMG